MKRKLRKVDGYVWCDKLGEIHEENLDPYEYGPPEAGEEDMRCHWTDHKTVYARQLEEN